MATDDDVLAAAGRALPDSAWRDRLGRRVLPSQRAEINGVRVGLALKNASSRQPDGKPWRHVGPKLKELLVEKDLGEYLEPHGDKWALSTRTPKAMAYRAQSSCYSFDPNAERVRLGSHMSGQWPTRERVADRWAAGQPWTDAPGAPLRGSGLQSSQVSAGEAPAPPVPSLRNPVDWNAYQAQLGAHMSGQWPVQRQAAAQWASGQAWDQAPGTPPQRGESDARRPQNPTQYTAHQPPQGPRR